MTGMGRDAELVKDQGQAGPGTPGMLNPGGFGAMTAILDVRAQWRGKPSRRNGLTGVCRHRYLQDGKSGRNTADGPKPELFGKSQVDLQAMQVSIGSPMITSADGMHATDVESNHLRYDNV